MNDHFENLFKLCKSPLIPIELNVNVEYKSFPWINNFEFIKSNSKYQIDRRRLPYSRFAYLWIISYDGTMTPIGDNQSESEHWALIWETYTLHTEVNESSKLYYNSFIHLIR